MNSISTRTWMLRLALVTLSIALGLWVALGLVPRWIGPPEVVRVIDSGIDPERVLGERVRDLSSLPPLSPDRLLERLPWSPEATAYFWPQLQGQGDNWEPHPILGARRRPQFESYLRHGEHPRGGYPVRCNSLGMRDAEPLANPDLRVLIAGDSQTEGVCANTESFANLWEARLAERYPDAEVEVLNAGQGGTSPWSYLNALEAYTDLRPDVFCPVFFGGNDFRGAIELERFHRQRGAGKGRYKLELQERLPDVTPGERHQEIDQAAYFLVNPRDREIGVEAWVALAMEMQRQCDAQGCTFRPVYLPPAHNGQPEVFAARLRAIEDAWPELHAELLALDQLVDAWIAELAARDVEVLDLRPAIRAAQAPLYWTRDLHLNLIGNAVVSEALERIEILPGALGE
ncbi:MAG: SGNH/GDSL hydrolase family protein [Planctomycetota bacterium]